MEDLFYEKLADDLRKSVRFFRYDLDDRYGERAVMHVLPHYHAVAEFCLVADGEYLARVGDTEFCLSAGDALFVGGFKPHYYMQKGKATVYALVFDERILSAFGNVGRTLPQRFQDGEGKELVRLFEESANAWGKATDEYKTGFLFRLVGEILQRYGTVEKEKDKGEKIMVSVMRYIEDHYTEDLSLASVASHFGYAEGYFSRVFNRYTGMNFREYLNRKRIALAQELEGKKEGLPLCRIAEMVGYRSWMTFHRAYQQYKK